MIKSGISALGAWSAEPGFGVRLAEPGFGIRLAELGFGVWLAAVAAEDFRSKKIKIWHIAAVLLPGIAYAAMYRYPGYTGESNFLTMLFYLLADFLPGIFLCCLSRLTKKGIGMGDALVTMAVGVYTGVRSALISLCAAFFLVFPAALLQYCLKKKQKTAAIPFLPFLFAGYIAVFFIEEG